jgi:PPOX class probable F420-dependent enzyme
VLHAVFDDGTIRISTTADRAKARNLAREPWAALHVTRADFGGYVVIEADVELKPVAADPNDATVDLLVEHYRALRAEQDDWPAFRARQVADRRLLVLLRPTRALRRASGVLTAHPRAADRQRRTFAWGSVARRL